MVSLRNRKLDYTWTTWIEFIANYSLNDSLKKYTKNLTSFSVDEFMPR